MADGYAVVERERINVRTVAPSRRAATVNWLHMNGHHISVGLNDDQIEKMWVEYSGTARVIQVYVSAVEEMVSSRCPTCDGLGRNVYNREMKDLRDSVLDDVEKKLLPIAELYSGRRKSGVLVGLDHDLLDQIAGLVELYNLILQARSKVDHSGR